MASKTGERPLWTDSYMFKIAEELGLVKPGKVKCLRCLEIFYSVDISTNRICPTCEKKNYDVLLNENCEDEFLYLEDPEVDIEALSFGSSFS